VAGVEPVEVSPLLARRALDAHLTRASDEDPRIERVDDLVLHVHLTAPAPGGAVDPYLLRLGFTHYDEWPPSAQFVNPATGAFVLGEDNVHLPRIEGSNELSVHADYGETHIQLICCSMTLEFYAVKHGVEDRHLWQQGTHTLWTTIHAIDRHLTPQWYRGRWS
jgi:hypothetical protein